MIIYNVTTKVDRHIQQAWLKWLKDEHIPDIVQTACFTDAVILHLIEADDEEGMTYAVQYHAESKASYNRYIEKYAEEMRARAKNKWGDRIVSFRTVMQVVN